jgi:hypothetical protein
LQNKNHQQGVLSIVANELLGQLRHGKDSGGLGENGFRDVLSNIHRAMNIAAQEVFAIDSATNNGPMDHHAYHIAILGRCRTRLQRRAVAYLVEKNVLLGMAALLQM